MDDEDLYDEFGNYIGDSLDSSDNDDDDENQDDLFAAAQPPSINDNEYSQDEEEEDANGKSQLVKTITTNSNDTALVKTNIDTNQAETIYIQSQTQSLSNQPIIQPNHEKTMKLEYLIDNNDPLTNNFPEVNYSRDYLISLLNQSPERIRNVSIIGDFQSGKTSLIDQLIMYIHPKINIKKYLDNHKLEIERELTIKSSPITLLLSDSKSRSQILNLIDTPGHVDFEDETLAALNITDGVVLIIDAVLGMTIQDQYLIDEVIKQRLSMIIIINKFDKLILELKLPIKDCYYKLVGIIDDINDYIKSITTTTTTTEKKKEYKYKYKFSPDLNNVLFASSKFGIIFSLKSFAKLYITKQNSLMNIDQFSKKLWGEIYYDPQNHKFTTTTTTTTTTTINNNNNSLKHSFISFILEPIYKIITYTITNEPTDKRLSKLLWENFRISLPKFEYKKDAENLLKSVFQTIFNNYESFVDSLIEMIPSPAKQQPNNSFSSSSSSSSLSSVDTLARVTKLIESSDGKSFSALVRIYKGGLTMGDKIKIYGENYHEDKDDYKLEIIKKIYLPGGRYNFPINQASLGNIVLIDGIDSIIKKGSAIITNESTNDTKDIDKLSFVPPSPPKYTNNSVFKIAIEPEIPSELPILLEGLRKINKSYLSSIINVEENGEHIILTKGELSMDCILHDLRFFFCDDLEIKVSDPMVKFSETCIENGYIRTSSTSTTTTTTTTTTNEDKDKDSLLSMTIIVEPIIDYKFSHDIEIGKLKFDNIDIDSKQLIKILKTEYGWDSLAARSLWAIGPINDLQNPSILLNDTLNQHHQQDNNNIIESIKSSIISGFKWSINEGPLCGDPIRNVQFKIIDITTNNNNKTTTSDNNNNNNNNKLLLSPAQIIPLMRRACHNAITNAIPKLMEPIYQLNVICSYKAINVIKHLLLNKNPQQQQQQRRGEIDTVTPIPGTPLFSIKGYLPVIDSIGILTDIKLNTQGQAIGSLKFNHWEIVPDELSEEFIIKTRKRKGI
ncbi:small GTP-binding protein domain [Candida albicans P75016]|nr:small GTP-binding protein domain [Candida albicans P75016]